MNDFISVLDIMDNAPYGAQKAVKDELADMEAGIRRTMDKGLTPDEMKTAQAAREAVQAASSILSRILN